MIHNSDKKSKNTLPLQPPFDPSKILPNPDHTIPHINKITKQPSQASTSANILSNNNSSAPADTKSSSPELPTPKSKSLLPHNDKLGRISLACMLCRRKKIKCDSAQPQCQNCKNRGVQCIYAKERKRGRPPRIYTYGDLIPPGKPIAPELQSAIEDAIIAQKLMNTIAPQNDTPNNNQDCKNNSDCLVDQPNLVQDTVFSNHTSVDLSTVNCVLPNKKRFFDSKDLPFEYSNKKYIKNPIKGFTSTYDSSLALANSPKSSILQNVTSFYYPPIQSTESFKKFVSIFFLHVPIFNKTALLEKINNKSIYLPLWVVISILNSENVDYSFRTASSTFHALIFDETFDIATHSLEICLQHLQSLLLLSIYYYSFSNFSKSHILLEKAIDLMVDCGFNSIDHKKSSSCSKTPNYNFSTNTIDSQLLTLHRTIKEEIRRTCWMIFVFDRILANIKSQNHILNSDSMLIKLPKSKLGYEFCESQDNTSCDINKNLTNQPVMVRSFRQAFSSAKTNGNLSCDLNNSYGNTSIESSPKSKSIIIYYIESALEMDLFKIILNSINSQLTPSLSLNSLKTSMNNFSRTSNQINDNNNIIDGNHTDLYQDSTLSNANFNSYYPGSNSHNSVGENSNILDFFGSKGNPSWLRSLYNQVNSLFSCNKNDLDASSNLNYTVNMSSTLNHSNVDHVMKFTKKITRIGVFLQAQSLIAFTASLDINYDDFFNNKSSKYTDWLNLVTWIMSFHTYSHNYYLHSLLENFDLKQNFISNLLRKANPDKHMRDAVLQIVAILLTCNFSVLFIEKRKDREMKFICPIVSKSTLRMISGRTNHIIDNNINFNKFHFAHKFAELLIDSSSNDKCELGSSKIENNISFFNLEFNSQASYFEQSFSSMPITGINNTNNISTDRASNITSESTKFDFTSYSPNKNDISLKSWKKSTEGALAVAASCAELARTIAFSSILSIDLTQSSDDYLASASIDNKIFALESLRYNFYIPLTLVSAIRILLTNYKMYPIFQAAKACICGFSDKTPNLKKLILKKVSFKNEINSANESLKNIINDRKKTKPAVWHVFDTNSEKSVNSLDSDQIFKKNQYLYDRSKSFNNYTNNIGEGYYDSLLTPCSLLDILHGLAALLSLLESVADFWNLESQLLDFEKNILEIQTRLPSEKNDKSETSSNTDVPQDKSGFTEYQQNTGYDKIYENNYNYKDFSNNFSLNEIGSKTKNNEHLYTKSCAKLGPILQNENTGKPLLSELTNIPEPICRHVDRETESNQYSNVYNQKSKMENSFSSSLYLKSNLNNTQNIYTSNENTHNFVSFNSQTYDNSEYRKTSSHQTQDQHIPTQLKKNDISAKILNTTHSANLATNTNFSANHEKSYPYNSRAFNDSNPSEYALNQTRYYDRGDRSFNAKTTTSPFSDIPNNNYFVSSKASDLPNMHLKNKEIISEINLHTYDIKPSVGENLPNKSIPISHLQRHDDTDISKAYDDINCNNSIGPYTDYACRTAYDKQLNLDQNSTKPYYPNLNSDNGSFIRNPESNLHFHSKNTNQEQIKTQHKKKYEKSSNYLPPLRNLGL
ncbi:hypothetical protein BB561_001237 [Smittium simulii]|uniref:Zn(2)-C6 fungal-type domain-containing protein n=1 Tax=Smittium simulii TaxID=133385 RepID=A0A2T9YVH1_9FUNG|nr:hypothetical protein BB561_001237 [Smittium simulii]